MTGMTGNAADTRPFKLIDLYVLLEEAVNQCVTNTTEEGEEFQALRFMLTQVEQYRNIYGDEFVVHLTYEQMSLINKNLKEHHDKD